MTPPSRPRSSPAYELTRYVQVTTRQQRDAGMVGSGLPPAGGAGASMPYGSEARDNSSAYGGGGGGHGVPSPSHSQANSMASSFRNIPQVSKALWPARGGRLPWTPLIFCVRTPSRHFVERTSVASAALGVVSE